MHQDGRSLFERVLPLKGDLGPCNNDLPVRQAPLAAVGEVLTRDFG